MKVCIRDHPAIAENNDILQSCLDEDISSAYICYKNFTEKIDVCLEPEEKYLPNFVLGYLNKFMSCDAQIKFTKVIEQTLNTTCVANSTVSVSLSTTIDKKCDFEIYKHLHETSFILKKSVICNDVKNVKDCMINEINKSCPSEDIIKVYYLRSITPLVELCE
ncbi:hypothetical protein ILUMI_08810 [Ignelater luminosus]|uniref:Uncharacterized protein n=1 Tax=Ignelater luminosus TaxID=2038154 RepID=A0A8K0D0Z3_IGNLU|nr:hypothetical protein ILUMI_08810 [Ignelater luminosus]